MAHFQRATIISAVLSLCIVSFLTGTKHSVTCFQEQGQTHECTCILRNPTEDTNPVSLRFQAGTPLHHILPSAVSLQRSLPEETRQGPVAAPLAFISRNSLALRSTVLLI